MNNFYFDHALESITDRYKSYQDKRKMKIYNHINEANKKVEDTLRILEEKDKKYGTHKADVLKRAMNTYPKYQQQKKKIEDNTKQRIEEDNKNKYLDSLYTKYHTNDKNELKEKIAKDIFSKIKTALNNLKSNKQMFSECKSAFCNGYGQYMDKEELDYYLNEINPSMLKSSDYEISNNRYEIQVIETEQDIQIDCINVVLKYVEKELKTLSILYKSLLSHKLISLGVGGDGDEGYLEINFHF